MNKIGLSVSHFSTCIKQAKLTATNHLTRENIKNINNRLWRKKKSETQQISFRILLYHRFCQPVSMRLIVMAEN